MIVRVQQTFTRPANTTAYTAGDVIGPAAGQGLIELSAPYPSVQVVGAALESNNTQSVDGVVYVVSSSTYAPGLDNAALTTPGYSDGFIATVALTDGWTGFGLIGVPIGAFSGGAFVATVPAAASGLSKLYAAVSAGTGFTPASGQQFRLSLYLEVTELGRF